MRPGRRAPPPATVPDGDRPTGRRRAGPVRRGRAAAPGATPAPARVRRRAPRPRFRARRRNVRTGSPPRRVS
ncbi:MAG: hypothetical protein FJW83_01535 [Actinobacteria bacterium]|nr:hypothetical protein [Actinomycetota bacterium]